MKMRRYFESFYPSRTSLIGRLLFRHGAGVLRATVRGFLGSVEGLSILDAGCGDGVFLASLLDGRPSRIVCEDIAPRAVAAAMQTLAAYDVEGVVADSLEAETDGFDVVLVIGVLDYQPDWRSALQRIARRSRGVVIATLPRRDRARNWLRRLWFLPQGIRLQCVSRNDIGGLDVRPARYEWVVRIQR